MSNGEVIVRPTPLWSDNPAARDLLGFADIAAPALEALARERLDPVTVGVVGWWGSGKSTILGLIERSAARAGGRRGCRHAAVGVRPVNRPEGHADR